MKVIPFKPEGYELLHKGAIALAQVEANGMKVDERYLDHAIKDTGTKIKKLTAEMQSSEVVRKWKKHFAGRMNINSNEQLGKVLFDIMGFDCPNRTATGKYATDEKTLATVDHPFIIAYLEIKKLEKARGTYLYGIKNETVHGLLHPVFNLHLAVTFRSSSDSPNFQNIPVRNADIRKLVRRAIRARKGRRLVEIDFRGVEVCGAACYHKDPRMIRYIEDKSKDMHRDMAIECYMLEDGDVDWGDKSGERIRYCAKNKFVFPEFYGSYYVQCAPELWGAISQLNLTLKDGTSLKKHLKRKGITELGACKHGEEPIEGTFESHIQDVERLLWKKKFPVYAQWKRDWYEQYKKRGWVEMLTGFVCQGFMKRNEVINYPVQGASFHCLLWSLIQLQLVELAKRKMRSLIVGQIHDSIIFDVPDEELDELLHMAQHVMTVMIREVWPWIIVPLEISAEVTPVGGNWEEKAKYKIK